MSQLSTCAINFRAEIQEKTSPWLFIQTGVHITLADFGHYATMLARNISTSNYWTKMEINGFSLHLLCSLTWTEQVEHLSYQFWCQNNGEKFAMVICTLYVHITMGHFKSKNIVLSGKSLVHLGLHLFSNIEWAKWLLLQLIFVLK